MKKTLTVLLIAAVLLFCLAAQADGITVTDMTGREIALEGPATRIVALTASDVEIVYAIGAGDLLVGRGEYCDYPAEALAVTSVQSGYETNIEQILSLDPDVVIMATMAQTTEQVQQLEDAGIRVIVSDAQDIAGVYEAIALIGQVTGHNDEAAALCEQMKATFAACTVAEPCGKTVYFKVSPLQWGLWTAGTGTFMDELAQMVGLTNAFDDVQGWAEVSEEQVIERDPDIIVTTSMSYGDDPSPVDEILGRAGWEGMKAVAGGMVCQADSDQVTRPGPRLMEAVQWLYQVVYGEQAEVPAA